MKTEIPKIEPAFFRVSYREPNCIPLLRDQLQQLLVYPPIYSEILFLCIGTDRSTGDALGPLVGTFLHEAKHPNILVRGTLEHPVHAKNLQDVLAEIDSAQTSPYVFAIDASLGRWQSVGDICLHKGPLQPGAGVQKKLPQVGHAHLTGIVNVGGFLEYFVLQNTRLHLVISMAHLISKAILAALPYEQPLVSEYMR
ncbi:spore protease YyaC [Rubeoparvulum massiliense]|uniref:spore protease YyaC n=1 Tax=Rubeoparvulum massiliense TaxID=1631346 RepID=UPI00065DFD3D|nr:spore protease YyaC [Rubeoparvulum massiliense]